MKWDDERCKALCPHETPWSKESKELSIISRRLNVKTRCALAKGHEGNHLGPDESSWKERRNG